MKLPTLKKDVFLSKAFTAFLFFTIFFYKGVLAQETTTLKAVVDTTTVRIGEQINLTLQLKTTDSLAKIAFLEQPVFAPFERIDESPIDTLRTQSHYLYTKRYALIHFDSGSFWIPQQQVFINGSSKISDSIPVAVLTVAVDTLKQKMYDIKPLQEVRRNYDALIENVLWIFVILFFLSGIVYVYFFQKRRRALKQQQLAPFERAIASLKELEKETPTVQDDYKNYYSQLTNIVRQYLEDEAKIDALESTSEELLLKLNVLKDSENLGLKKETIDSLKEVLQKADLVKFAKSLPERGTTIKDLHTIESVIVDTKEALPEPTKEELEEQAAYQNMMARKRRKKELLLGLAVATITPLLALIISIAVYGFYPVMDALWQPATYKMYNADWVTSQYGTPPVRVETPMVLKREESTKPGTQTFSLGDWDSPFYIRLHFDIEKPKSTEDESPEKTQEERQKENMQKAQTYVDEAISAFESEGATNILMKTDPHSFPSGLSGIKIYGTLDYPKKGYSERVRCDFTTYLMPFEEGSITFTMMYEKEDRYASEIRQRIMKSLDLIKEL